SQCPDKLAPTDDRSAQACRDTDLMFFRREKAHRCPRICKSCPRRSEARDRPLLSFWRSARFGRWAVSRRRFELRIKLLAIFTNIGTRSSALLVRDSRVARLKMA